MRGRRYFFAQTLTLCNKQPLGTAKSTYMKYTTLFLALTVLLLATVPLWAQQTITLAQEQLIKTKAANFVKTYTTQLELLTKAKEADEKESYKQTIYLRFGKDKGNTRVYNDLIPPRLRQQPMTMETSVPLASYLSKLSELYPDGIKLAYSNPQVSEVFYSRNDNWYFVKVTADRKIEGVYLFKTERTPYQAQEKTDFFVNAFLQNGEVKMGAIYGVSPHENNTDSYTKARIIRGQDELGSSILSIGKPLKIATDVKDRKFKRGKEYRVEWEGGLGDDIIQLELIPQDTTRMKRKRYEPVLNSNKYTFNLPNDTRIGKYQFKVKNVSTGRSVQSGYFTVRRTVPLGVKAAAIPVVSVAAYLVYKAIDKDNSGSSSIEAPPFPE